MRQGALIGFGNIAEKGHWPAYADAAHGLTIAAIVDPSAERCAAAKALRGDLRCYRSFEELLRMERLDFVDICTPPSSHAGLAVQALKAGVHVLCEKPLTLSEHDFEILARESLKQDRTLFTVHNWTQAPIIQAALSQVRAGRVGDVQDVHIQVWRDRVCPGASQAKTPEDWRRDAAIAGGGIVVDHGWHAFYLAQEFVAQAPRRLTAHLSMPDYGPLEEAARILIDFPTATGWIDLTWRASSRANRLQIKGSQGLLWLEDDRLIWVPREGVSETELFPSSLSQGSHHADWFRPLLQEFAAEMNDPAQRGRNLRQAGWCVAMTAAAYLSKLKGFSPVELEYPGGPSDHAAAA